MTLNIDLILFLYIIIFYMIINNIETSKIIMMEHELLSISLNDITINIYIPCD